MYAVTRLGFSFKIALTVFTLLALSSILPTRNSQARSSSSPLSGILLPGRDLRLCWIFSACGLKLIFSSISLQTQYELRPRCIVPQQVLSLLTGLSHLPVSLQNPSPLFSNMSKGVCLQVPSILTRNAVIAVECERESGTKAIAP